MAITDETLEERVRATLADDRRLPHPDAIAVVADESGGIVLRGTVGSLTQLRAAVADARRTRGVIDVLDELDVRLLDEDQRRDADIRCEALQRLTGDARIPGDSIDVHVKDGWVTLEGELDLQEQSDIAFEHAAGLDGVTGVTNDVTVVQRL